MRIFGNIGFPPTPPFPSPSTLTITINASFNTKNPDCYL